MDDPFSLAKTVCTGKGGIIKWNSGWIFHRRCARNGLHMQALRKWCVQHMYCILGLWPVRPPLNASMKGRIIEWSSGWICHKRCARNGLHMQAMSTWCVQHMRQTGRQTMMHFPVACMCAGGSSCQGPKKFKIYLNTFSESWWLCPSPLTAKDRRNSKSISTQF